MDLALESLKEVIVLLRSSEIGNSGAILAKLPPSRFECNCFQITADLPSLAQFRAIFKAVLKAPQCCQERHLAFKTVLPQTILAGLQTQGAAAGRELQQKEMFGFMGWGQLPGQGGRGKRQKGNN